jgi:hypothetical protein
MPSFDLFSIGHSNIPAGRFVAMLKTAGVDAIADVCSTPFSRRFPWFSAKNLAPRLAQDGIGYAAHGDTLGGRPRDDALYSGGVADYEAMARQPQFQVGLGQVLADALARLPDVRGTRAARLPPLPAGGACPRRARRRYRPHSA